MNVLLKANDQKALADVLLFRDSLHHSCQPQQSGLIDHDKIREQPDIQERHNSASVPAAPDPRVEQLQAEITVLQRKLEQAGEDRGTAETEAFERGRLHGDKEALKNTEAALSKLSAMLDVTQQDFSKGFEQFEALALHITQIALGKILGDGSQFSQMVFEAVRHQLAEIEGNLVTGVRVSPQDFPDSDAVAQIASQFPKVEVIADPDLVAGECVMDLRMGEIDISPARQWSRLSGLLDQWIKESAPS